MNTHPARRDDPRIEADQPVTVTLLGYPDISFSGKLANISGRGACLELDRHVPPSSLLKIETDDTLLLGEAVYSHPVANGFQVGVSLEHALHHTGALAGLARRLLGEETVEELRR